MASPRLAALKSLSPRPVENLRGIRNSLSPRTPKNKIGDTLKVEHTKSSQRNRFSPFKVDTPNRIKILKHGLPQKELAVLGSGCFGTVYKASYRGDQVAAKIVRRRKCSDAAVSAERQAAFLRHSNIVRVLAIEEGSVWSMITMELCGTSLQDRLDQTSLSPRERLSTLKAIGSALQFCHRAGIIHADVKPKNVLIARDGQPKLADFGSSVVAGQPCLSTGLHGTPGYAAPEVIRGKSPNAQSDIYSLGILAWQLLHREAPFAGLHSHTILYLTGKGARPEDRLLEDGFNGEYKLLYKTLWSERTSDRPSLAEILSRLEDFEEYAQSRSRSTLIYKN